MAVKYLNYLDIDPAQRAEAANEARRRLRAHLATPFITPDAAAQVHAQIAKIDAWEQGALPKPPPKSTGSHVVKITEDVKVDES